jgi:Trypsin
VVANGLSLPLVECTSKNFQSRDNHLEQRNVSHYEKKSRYSPMVEIGHFSEPKSKEPSWSCNAVITGRKTVITTARCALATNFKVKVKVLMRIKDGPVTVDVAKTHVHPKYNPKTGENDVAILETKSNLTEFGNEVTAVYAVDFKNTLPINMIQTTSINGMIDFNLLFLSPDDIFSNHFQLRVAVFSEKCIPS